MAQQLTSQEQRAVQAIYGHAAQMMQMGHSDYRIEKDLQGRGLSEQASRSVMSNLRTARNKATKDAALKAMAIGGAICLFRIVVTLGTFSAASNNPGGGSYVVAWGAVIFGGWRFFQGLMAYSE